MTLSANVDALATRVAEEINAVRAEMVNGFKPVAGDYIDNAFLAGVGTLAGVANRMDMAPMLNNVDIAVDRIGAAVSTAVASAQIKVVLYDSDANGRPNNLLHETAALDASTTGYKFETISRTLTGGRLYWVGVRHSSTATIRTIAVNSAYALGLGTASTSTTTGTILRRTVTFASGAPDPWSYVTGDVVTNTTPPSVRFRVA